MKLRSIITSLFILTIFALQAYASAIPVDIRNYLQSGKKIPTVRFDGLIVYSDDVMYLPVIPAHINKVDQIKIVKTYPLNQNMDSLPDLVLFNNNYGLVKIIRTGENTLTVRNMPDIPDEIITGLIPQDILVPRGLVFPENLAQILGDIQVPFIGSAKTPSFIGARKSAPLPGGKRVDNTKKYTVPSALKNKLFYVNNFQTEYLQVFSSDVSEPLYFLKTSGVMKDVKPFNNGKYLIVATNRQKNLDIIDVSNEYVTKHIDLTAFPTEIAVDELNKLAYVASEEDESLFVINLETFSVKEKIRLAGSPKKLAISDDGTKIAYTDINTSCIYILDLTDDYSNKLITKYPNVTKLIFDNNRIYIAARTIPKLRVVDFDLTADNRKAKTKQDIKNEELIKQEAKSDADLVTNDIVSGFTFGKADEGDYVDDEAITYSTSIRDYDIGDKPVDMAKYNNKIFVLCAGNNTVYNFDINSETLTNNKLPMDGFSKSFSLVPGSDLAVITNTGDFKYAVYDTRQEKAIQTVPVSEYINMITVLERQ